MNVISIKTNKQKMSSGLGVSRPALTHLFISKPSFSHCPNNTKGRDAKHGARFQAHGKNAVDGSHVCRSGGNSHPARTCAQLRLRGWELCCSLLGSSGGEAASGKTPHSRPEGERRFTAAERGLSSAHTLTLIQKGKRNMQLCQKSRISEPCITDL